jgi:ribokinase
LADIVVIGSLNMDLVVRVARMPRGGETVPGGDLQLIPGGKGANQAVAAARLGSSVAMVGRVGNDAFGPRLVDGLGSQGVDVTHVTADTDIATGTAMILVDDRGENSIVVSPGANGRVGRQDVDCAEPLLRGARLLLLQFEIPQRTVEYALEAAARHGVPAILNPAPARPIPASLLAGVQYLVPNETEAALLSGIEVQGLDSAEAAALGLLALMPQGGTLRGGPAIVLTLGQQGALLVSHERVLHVPARAVNVVDTTAAGDAFIGGLSVALSQGAALDDAVHYAVCAGTLAVTKLGAQTSLPSAGEVEAFRAGEFLGE